MRNLILLVFVLSLLSSSQPKEKKNTMTVVSKPMIFRNDNEIAVTIQTGITYLDSRSGTLTRNTESGTQTYHFKFTELELEKIKSLYIDTKLDMLPDNYTPNCEINMTSTSDEKIIVYFKGKKKSIIYSDGYDCSEKQSKIIVAKIKNFHHYIFKTVLEKESVDGSN